jgi:hypothetical protein
VSTLSIPDALGCDGKPVLSANFIVMPEVSKHCMAARPHQLNFIFGTTIFTSGLLIRVVAIENSHIGNSYSLASSTRLG